MEITKQQIIHTDVLIIGGGTAGCYAALTIREKSGAKIVIAEKANIKRSGCLAAGVNAINAYIVKGENHRIMLIMRGKMQMRSYEVTCFLQCQNI